MERGQKEKVLNVLHVLLGNFTPADMNAIVDAMDRAMANPGLDVDITLRDVDIPMPKEFFFRLAVAICGFTNLHSCSSSKKGQPPTLSSYSWYYPDHNRRFEFIRDSTRWHLRVHQF